MDKDNEIKIGEATYTVERQFSGKKTLKELLVEHIVSAKKKEDAMNAPDIDEIAYRNSVHLTKRAGYLAETLASCLFLFAYVVGHCSSVFIS